MIKNANRVALVVLVCVLAAAGPHQQKTQAQSASLRWDGAMEDVARRDANWTPPFTGRPWLSRHAVSEDGRRIVFQQAIQNGPDQVLQMLLWHDRQTNETSAFIGAEIGARPVISAEGNHIAFEACDGWLRPDYQPYCDLYVADIRDWSFVSMTTAEDGSQLPGATTDPMLSATGRFVVFSGDSPSLIPPGAPGQIIWRDRDADEDGIFDEPGAVQVRVVSVSSAGVAGNEKSELPQVSRDGRFIAFRSRASNLVAGDDNGDYDLFLHDRQTGETRRINIASPTQAPSITLEHFSMSENGNLVAFATNHEGIGTPPTHATDTNGTFDVVIYDRQAETWSRVNIGTGGAVGNGPTDTPAFSADGRYIVVRSTATNVNGVVTPGRSHVYAHDRQTGETTQISVATDGAEANADAIEPLISADGSLVVFTSHATNLVAGVDESRPTAFAASHFSVSPAALSITTRGNEVTAQVTAQRYVKWLGYHLSEWVWSLGTPMGQGDGTLQFSAGVNQQPDPRTATIEVYRSLGHPWEWNPTGTPKSIVITQDPGISASGMSPVSGSMSGGTLVTITGTSFEPDMSAFVDGYQATLQYVDSTTVRVITPVATRRGEVWIWLQTSDYRYALVPGTFRYVDTTPPAIYPNAFGPESNGWFTGNVQVYFNVEDDESDIISWSPQCMYQEVTADTPGTTFTCTATTEGGTATASITVRRDTTEPVIRLNAPQTAIYPPGTPLTVDYVCEDATSGIAQCTAPLPNGATLPMSPGFYEFLVEARDNAGYLRQEIARYAVATGQCEARPSGLVAWWPWEEASQPSFRDTVSGALATGVNLAPSFGPGFIGSFAPSMIGEVYGQDSYVNAGTRADLQMSNAFTLAAWVYRAPTATMETRIIAGREGEYLLGHDPLGNIIFAVAHPALGFNFRYANLPPIPVGQWAHVAMTYDGVTLRLFVNGLSSDWSRWTLDGPIGDELPEQNEFRIGSRQGLSPSTYGLSFLGRIDDVMVLNRGLSEAEMQRMFLAGNLGLCAARTPSLVVTPSSVPVTFGGTTTVEIVTTVRDGDVPLMGRTVSVYQHGAPLGSGVTDTNGDARITVTVNGDAPETGDHSLEVRHTADYLYEAGASVVVPVTVNPAKPLIIWGTPAAITFGTLLDATQLNATANTDGTFAYTPPAGTRLVAGTHTLEVDFTPSDSQHYTAASFSVSLVVTKATPTVSVTGGTFTYDGQPHAATGTVTGVDGAILAPATLTYNGSTTVPVNAGTYEVVATFAGDANYEAASATATLTIGKATPTVSATGGIFTYDGQPHAATGSATGIGGATLSPLTFAYNGSADVPVNAGSYAVVASFAGDANYEAATATATLTIGKATPTVNATGGTFTYDGQPHAAAGTVTGIPGAAPGPLTFTYNGSSSVPLAAGSYSVVATFAGDANYEAASASTTITIERAPLVIRANDATKRFGSPLPALTAAATGFVAGETLASLTGSLSVATTATQQSAVGTYPITVAGVSSPNYAIAFVTGTLTITRGTVAVAVSSSPQPSGLDMPMTFAASVTAAEAAGVAPTGVVQFLTGGTLIGSAPLAGESASISTAGLPAGTHAIEARYLGDGSFDTGIGAGSHTVRDASGTPAITVTSSRNPANLGQSVTLTANIAMASGPVSGTIQFYDGATLLGSGPISAGRATFTTSSLSAGSHAVVARFAGNATAPPAMSPVFVQAVGASGWKDRATTMTLTTAPEPSTVGGPVTVTATVSGSSGTPTGRILILVNGEAVGDPTGIVVTPVSGSARVSIVVPGLNHGSHTISATYLGDPTYKGSTAQVAHRVN